MPELGYLNHRDALVTKGCLEDTDVDTGPLVVEQLAVWDPTAGEVNHPVGMTLCNARATVLPNRSWRVHERLDHDPHLGPCGV